MMDSLNNSEMINAQKNNKRIAWLDFAKLMAIYLVLYGHTLQYLKTDIDPHYNYMWLFIYSFHMPLFMLISGYFSYGILHDKFSTLIKKKTLQLIVPCLIWGGFWYFLKFVLVYNDVADAIINVLQDLNWITMDVLWFLKSLFLCMLLCYIFKSNIWFILLSILLSQIMPFKLPLMYPCFLFGVFCREKHVFDKINVKWSVVLVLLFVVMYSFFKPQHMLTNLRATAIGALSGDYLPFLIECKNRFFCLLIGIIGSLALISVCKSLNRLLEKSYYGDKLSKFGSQTQAVYILHGPIMVYGLAALINLNSMNVDFFNIVVCSAITLALLALCLYFINSCPPKVREILFGSRN